MFEANQGVHMNARKIGYWATTALVSLPLAGSAVAKLTNDPTITANMERLGYPLYMSKLLAVWYIGAVVVLLATRLLRAKEWAYAGAFFAMSGAFISHLAVGDSAKDTLPGLVICGLIVASYVLRPDNRRLIPS